MKALLAMALGCVAIVACDPPVDGDDSGTAGFPATCAAADKLGPYESDADPFPATTLDELAAECAAVELSCPQAALLTRQQAMCVAVDAGLPPGIRPLQANLGVHHDFDRPVWSVSSTEFVGEFEEWGTTFEIDALTGDVLEEYGWGWTALSRQ